MVRHPELAVLEAPLASDPAEFMDHGLTDLLRNHEPTALGFHGRYGIRKGRREWVVDLDLARVIADPHRAVVTDDDDLDAVVVIADDGSASVTVHAAGSDGITPFVDWLTRATRS